MQRACLALSSKIVKGYVLADTELPPVTTEPTSGDVYSPKDSGKSS